MIDAAGPPRVTQPSLAFSLRMFAEESPSLLRGVALRRVADAVEQGQTWPSAVAAAGPFLPQSLKGVLIAADRTGSVEQVVGDHLAGSRRVRRSRLRVLLALVYPFALLCGVTLLMLGVLVAIVPSFTAIFNDFGVELPPLTLALVMASSVTLLVWPYVLGCLVAVGILLAGVLLIQRLPLTAPLVRLLQSVPMLGLASQLNAASEFCTLLAILVRARIPLPEALRLTSAGMHDANLRQGTALLARRVESGDSPEYAASVLPHFSPRLVQVLRPTADETAYAEILRSHGELFALLAEAQSSVAILWLQPFVLVVVGMLGGLVVIGLFLPLIKLLNELS